MISALLVMNGLLMGITMALALYVHIQYQLHRSEGKRIHKELNEALQTLSETHNDFVQVQQKIFASISDHSVEIAMLKGVRGVK